MIALGIESTAHTFGIGIVGSEGKILSNIKKSYSSHDGGMIPHQLADHHTSIATDLIKEALKQAEVTFDDIKLIAFSQGPGIGNALRIGCFVARQLSIKYNKPILGVNHCIAHLSIGKVCTRAKDPVLLYASGANTQIIAFETGKYRIFGETLDMGVGNCIDQLARLMGLGFPGGPALEKLAAQGNEYIDMPYDVKGMDLTFGGLFTFVKSRLHLHRKEDLAYSIQEVIFAQLLEVAERAMAHLGKNELVLGGGVGCNKRLQAMAESMCLNRGAKAYAPPAGVLVDNGAMIAWQGIVDWQSGKRQELKDTGMRPYWRTDEE